MHIMHNAMIYSSTISNIKLLALFNICHEASWGWWGIMGGAGFFSCPRSTGYTQMKLLQHLTATGAVNTLCFLLTQGKSCQTVCVCHCDRRLRGIIHLISCPWENTCKSADKWNCCSRETVSVVEVSNSSTVLTLKQPPQLHVLNIKSSRFTTNLSWLSL